MRTMSIRMSKFKSQIIILGGRYERQIIMSYRFAMSMVAGW